MIYVSINPHPRPGLEKKWIGIRQDGCDQSSKLLAMGLDKLKKKENNSGGDWKNKVD